jgi:hypothetical protein
MGIVDTMDLLQGSRFRNNPWDRGRDTCDRGDETGVGLRVMGIFMAGTGRINDGRTASHEKILRILEG